MASSLTPDERARRDLRRALERAARTAWACNSSAWRRRARAIDMQRALKAVDLQGLEGVKEALLLKLDELESRARKAENEAWEFARDVSSLARLLGASHKS